MIIQGELKHYVAVGFDKVKIQVQKTELFNPIGMSILLKLLS